jgi:hypothetical protein
MSDLWKKLNYKDHDPVVVLRAPDSFAPALEELAAYATVHISSAKVKSLGFAIAFATKQQEVDAAAHALAAKLEGDAVLWMAYPKGSSKRYTCDFNRDTGWTELGKLGFEPVRQVAIDEDWSALRFRKVSYIKKLTRSFAMTEEGKARAKTPTKAPAKTPAKARAKKA